MDPKLTKLLLIGSLIFLVVIVPIFFNLIFSGSKKIRISVNILIFAGAAVWLLKILGMLNTVVGTITLWTKSL